MPDDEQSTWEALTDDDGDTYYHNTATGETTWQRPAQLGSPDQAEAGDKEPQRRKEAFLSAMLGGDEAAMTDEERTKLEHENAKSAMLRSQMRTYSGGKSGKIKSKGKAKKKGNKKKGKKKGKKGGGEQTA